MADIVNVAQYIMSECGNLSTMKLQKLVYYSQAYHLVRFGAPLFDDRIEAWANGPVVRSLFKRHQGYFVISEGFFGQKPNDALDDNAVASIEHVLSRVGSFSGAELSDLTHSEKPWVDARRGLAPSERSDREITLKSIKEFYSQPGCVNPVFA